MKGFSFWGSQFGDDIHAFFTNLGDPQNKIVNEMNSFTLTTKKSVEVNIIGNGINALPDKIEQGKKADGVKGQVIKGINKDYSKILENVIEGSLVKPNSVSAFISDFVYHPGDAEGKDLNAFLKSQSQRMRGTIQTALSKNPDLCMVLLQGVSDYKWDNKVTPNRPYYLVFLGKKSNLQTIMGFTQKNWKGNYFWFEFLKSTVSPKLVVARNHPWAKGTYETNRINENLIINPSLRPGNTEFSFVSEVDLADFKGLEYLLKDGSKYNGGDWTVSKVGFEPRYKSNLTGAFQFEIKTRSKLKPCEFEIRLPYHKPSWISQSSHDKPDGSILETEFEGKTFGFEPLMNGVLEAFHIGDKELIKLKFKIER